MSDCVWYVAYGSNLSAERFALYLAKSADTTAPSGSRPLRIAHPVVFSGESKRWSGGGVAFLDLDTEAASASYCRAWRITTSQFEDVFRQSYLDVISIGLAETWGLTSAQAVAYLHSCPGNEPLLPPDA